MWSVVEGNRKRAVGKNTALYDKYLFPGQDGRFSASAAPGTAVQWFIYDLSICSGLCVCVYVGQAEGA